jgi:RNA polymerase sigma-70 factor (ECF subfamily)
MGDVISLRPGLDSGSWGSAEESRDGTDPGEEEAVRLVYLVHEPALRRRALRLARARDAEWLVRDTFDLFLKHRDRAGSATSLVVWLFVAMRDLFITRTRLRRPRVVGAQAAGDEPVEPPVWAQSSRAQFAAAVAALPPDFRRVFELHAVDGLTYQQIATRLELTTVAVFARLFRARLLLKDILRDLVEGRRPRDVGM